MGAALCTCTSSQKRRTHVLAGVWAVVAEHRVWCKFTCTGFSIVSLGEQDCAFHCLELFHAPLESVC